MDDGGKIFAGDNGEWIAMKKALKEDDSVRIHFPIKSMILFISNVSRLHVLKPNSRDQWRTTFIQSPQIPCGMTSGSL